MRVRLGPGGRRYSYCLFYSNRFSGLIHQSLKARIVAQRVPPRMQTQLPIRNGPGNSYHCFQLLKRKIVFTGPTISDRQVSQDLRTCYRILCHWKEFDRAPCRDSSAAQLLKCATATKRSVKVRRLSRLDTVATYPFGCCSHGAPSP